MLEVSCISGCVQLVNNKGATGCFSGGIKVWTIVVNLLITHAVTNNEKIESKFIVKGRLHSPYFIYFKAGRELSDDEILKTFDLDGFEPNRGKIDYPCRNQVVHVETSPTWSLLADDWNYSLGFSDGAEEKMQIISRQFDIYKCWIGDTGYEYHFTLYAGGEVVRDFSYWGGVV